MNDQLRVETPPTIKPGVIVLRSPCLIFTMCFLFFLIGASACHPTHEREVQQLMDQAKTAARSGDYAKAARLWEHAVQVVPDRADLYVHLADVSIRKGDLKQAKVNYDKALSISPERTAWRYEQGKLCILLGDTKGLKECFAHLRSGSVTFSLLRGDQLFSAKRFTAALQAYNQVLHLSPQQPTALIRAAICSLHLQEKKQAAAFYSRLLAVKDLDPVIRLEMADYWRVQGQPEKAEQIVLAAAREDPKDPLLIHRVIELRMDQGDFQSALHAINTLQSTMDADTFLKKAETQCLLELGHLDLAEQRLRELQEVADPDDPDVVFLQGSLHLFKGNTVQAVGLFERAGKMMSRHQQLAEYFKGLALLQGGKTHLAKTAFVRALAMDPTFTEAEMALAAVSYHQNDLDVASQYVHRILEQEPEKAEVHFFNGLIQLTAGKTQDALNAFDRALRLDTSMAEATLLEALAYERMGAQKQAITAYTSLVNGHKPLLEAALGIVRLGKKSDLVKVERMVLSSTQAKMSLPFNRYVAGLLALRRNEPARAEQAFKKAIRLAPDFTAAYLRLADVYRMHNEWEKVISILQLAVDRKTSSPRVYSLLAQAYRRHGKTDQAVVVLEKGLARNPHNGPLAANLAWMYMDQGEYQERVFNLAQSAYSENPENAAIVDTLGWAFYHRKLYTRAIWLFEQGVNLEPDNPVLFFHLGLAWLEDGGEGRAAAALHKALDRGLEGSEKLRAKEILGSLHSTAGG